MSTIYFVGNYDEHIHGATADMLQDIQDATSSSSETFTLQIDASTSATPAEGTDVIELGKRFDYEGYQVVRREFFAHINEPTGPIGEGPSRSPAACFLQWSFH